MFPVPHCRYEDSGEDLAYKTGVYAITNLSLGVSATSTTLTVACDGGHAAAGLLDHRRFEARFFGAPADAAGWTWSGPAAIGQECV